MIEVYYIPAIGESKVVKIEPTLKEYQKLVKGYIEKVEINASDKVMIVNEEGLLEYKLPNQAASAIASRHIVGDVFVIDRQTFEEGG